MKRIPDTYEQLADSFIAMLPREYQQIDIVADSYLETSIKAAERLKRGVSSKILITSAKSKIPRDCYVSTMENSRRASHVTDTRERRAHE